MEVDLLPDPITVPGAPMLPDERGRFGRFGGQYAPETLMPAIAELIAEEEPEPEGLEDAPAEAQFDGTEPEGADAASAGDAPPAG